MLYESKTINENIATEFAKNYFTAFHHKRHTNLCRYNGNVNNFNMTLVYFLSEKLKHIKCIVDTDKTALMWYTLYWIVLSLYSSLAYNSICINSLANNSICINSLANNSTRIRL